MRYRDLRGVLSSTVAVMAVAVSTPAFAQVRNFNIPAQSAVTGIPALAKQADIQLLVSSDAVEGKTIRALKGRMTVDEAIRRLLGDADLQVVNSDGKTYTLAPKVRERTALQAPAYQAAQSAPQYDEIIVTAQKKEERITDVPIAMSAFSAEALDDYKIEGGSELLRAVPNVNFSKSNFSMYNFSIRGIGTKAISASSDPAVAVSFNNTPLVRNRLFEAEFFDMQRIEVLRGPQGTLYGRNATAGVVNLISALPKNEFEGEIKAETGNFKTRRLSGILNVPLTDALGVRVAGMMTKRNGFDYNTFTAKNVNGRDLWSTRVSASWEPSDNFKASLIWQHFAENDDRARTGKQLCTRDEGPAKIGENEVSGFIRGRFSQGCLPGSLYDDAAFGAPNGYMLAYLWVAQQMQFGSFAGPTPRERAYAVRGGDPYENVVQSRNLREINTTYDPKFKAKNDVLQLNIDLNLNDKVKIVSQSSYSKDDYFSTQDYSRFVSDVVFNDLSRPRIGLLNRVIDPVLYPGPTVNGQFCDYQLGCSDRIASADLSTSDNEQWYQELRVQSSFDGIFNFNIGANYLKFKSEDKYYVFNNLFTLISDYWFGRTVPTLGINVPDCPLGFEGRECVYSDPNPIGSLNDQGHNYFLSKNGIETTSRALFGEAYFQLNDTLKLTLGGRYTDDKKISSQVPSQLLLGGGLDLPIAGQIGASTGGRVNSGYPSQPNIYQRWKEFTGRIVLDWKPELSFSDDTLVYASISRGYKGGGTNPPRVDIDPLLVKSFDLPQTFEPEYLNSFEIGTKNSFGGGRYTLNASAFYYDYKNYQISQIVDRIAYNENFDVQNWGLELEAAWRPSPRFRVDATLGYLRTRLAKGSESIDVMDRTQGDPEWMVVRPWLQAPSNCIAPRAYVDQILSIGGAATFAALSALCPSGSRVGDFDPTTSYSNQHHLTYLFTYDPLAPYDPTKVGAIVPYDPANPDAWIGQSSGAPNFARGFMADLAGHELPNAPRMTFNVGAEYRIPLSNDHWELTVRGDYYRQSKSYGRIYNTKFDRIRGWDNVNLAISLINNDEDLEFQFYVKNVFNNDSITDFFVNSDDTGLTANIFNVDPRLIGFSVKKGF